MTTELFTPAALLVVDDDELYRESLVRAFSRRGIHTTGAHSVETALSAASHLAPDAAIIDLKLGNESGLDVVGKLIEHYPAMRIVVLTAYGTIATALEAIKLGAVNYLTKPVQIEHILSAFNGRTPSPQALSAIPSAEQVEWDYINRTVQEFGGNVTRAAQALGLHRRSLQRKLKNPPSIK
jgi:two-component system response regulator RegA